MRIWSRLQEGVKKVWRITKGVVCGIVGAIVGCIAGPLLGPIDLYRKFYAAMREHGSSKPRAVMGGILVGIIIGPFAGLIEGIGEGCSYGFNYGCGNPLHKNQQIAPAVMLTSPVKKEIDARPVLVPMEAPVSKATALYSVSPFSSLRARDRGKKKSSVKSIAIPSTVREENEQENSPQHTSKKYR